MKTIITNVYQFSELDKQAKQRAIEVCQGVNVSDEWWESIFEDAKDIGLKITKFDIRTDCIGSFMLSAHEVAANIIRYHGKQCETYKTAQSFLDSVGEIQGKYDEFEGKEYETEMIEVEDDFLKSLLKDYHIILSKEYDYLTGESSIIETIEANEYKFTADGNRFKKL